MSIENSRIGFRQLPDSIQIRRRRRLLQWTKWLLPISALLLLASIAVWPEIDRSINTARLGLAEANHVRMDTGRMLGARYRGLDTHDRPYMITADEAQQVTARTVITPTTAPPGGLSKPTASPSAPPSSSSLHPGVEMDRINLTRPVADTLTQGGNWLQISARTGVYMQRSQVLDVTQDVTLYRDDGIIMTSPVADFDLKGGVIASNAWVHAEGPFGVLDAQGYLLSQREGIAQFRGPGRLVLNDDRITTPHHPANEDTAGPEHGHPIGTQRQVEATPQGSSR